MTKSNEQEIRTPVGEFAKNAVVWVTVGPKRTRCRGEVQAVNPKNLKVRFTWGNGRTTVRDFSIEDGLVTDVEFASDLPQVSTSIEPTPEKLADANAVAKRKVNPPARGKKAGTTMAKTTAVVEAKIADAQPTIDTEAARKNAPALAAGEIAGLDGLTRYNMAKAEKRAVDAAKKAGKPKPATPVIDWINAHPTKTREATPKASTGSTSSRGPSVPESDQRKLVEDAVKAGARSVGAVKKALRAQGKPCSSKWVVPIFATLDVEKLQAKPKGKTTKAA